MSIWGLSHQSHHNCSIKFRVPIMSVNPFSLISYCIVVCDGIRASLEGHYSYEVLDGTGWAGQLEQQGSLIQRCGSSGRRGPLRLLLVFSRSWGSAAAPWLAIPSQPLVMLRHVSQPPDSAQYAEHVHA